MQPLLVVTSALLALGFGTGFTDDEQEVSFSDCPAAVRKTFEAEAKGVKFDTLTKEKDEDDQTVYWADVPLGDKTYAIGVLEDGTLTEMNLAVDEEELALEKCPAAVQATFRSEAFGEKVGLVGQEMKYGVTVYETAVVHNGKSYEIVVAQDGTLVEKVLVINDEEIELANCPAAVKATLRAHAKEGTIADITHSTGIGQHTFEAELKIKTKVYLVEIAESGLLISKSLEASQE